MRWRIVGLITATLLTTSCGAAQRLSGSASSAPSDWLSQVQPFVNRPAPAYVRPELRPSPYPTLAPLCQASQLEAVQGRGGVGLGNILLRVDFTNVSQAPCQLSGTPRVEGVDAAGRLVGLPVTGNRTYFIDPIPGDLAPGESGYLNIGMTNEGNCPGAAPAAEYTNLRFEMPGGGWIATNLHASKACDVLEISGLGKEPGPVVEPTPSPGSPGTLRARLEDFPEKPRAGATALFVIALINDTDLDISLSPCPSYTVIVNPLSGRLISESRYLNCDHVAVIPARSTVRYAMALPIPGGLDWRLAKFAWNLNMPFGPFVGGVLDNRYGDVVLENWSPAR